MCAEYILPASGSIGPITKSECVQSDVSGDDVTLEPTNNTGTTSEPPQTDQQEDADDLVSGLPSSSMKTCYNESFPFFLQLEMM